MKIPLFYCRYFCRFAPAAKEWTEALREYVKEMRGKGGGGRKGEWGEGGEWL